MTECNLLELFEEFVYYHENRYSWALSRISDLEEELAEARDVIHRLIEGDSQEWYV